jgi:hypothetical protein
MAPIVIWTLRCMANREVLAYLQETARRYPGRALRRRDGGGCCGTNGLLPREIELPGLCPDVVHSRAYGPHSDNHQSRSWWQCRGKAVRPRTTGGS